MGYYGWILRWDNDRYMIREWRDIPRLCHYNFIEYDPYDQYIIPQQFRQSKALHAGRICMFATIGMVWPDLFGKFDGNSARGRIRLGSMGTRKVLNGKTEFMTFQISCAYFFKALPSGKLT